MSKTWNRTYVAWSEKRADDKAHRQRRQRSKNRPSQGRCKADAAWLKSLDGSELATVEL